MTHVYLSAPYSRMHELRLYRVELQELGLSVTARWLDGDPDDADDPALMTEDEMEDAARQDLEDLRQAHILIAFSEAGAAPTPATSRGGRHVEFGYAIAAKALSKRGQYGWPQREIWMVGPPENVFGVLVDQRFAHWGELLAYVRGRSEDARFDVAAAEEASRD